MYIQMCALQCTSIKIDINKKKTQDKTRLILMWVIKIGVLMYVLNRTVFSDI